MSKSEAVKEWRKKTKQLLIDGLGSKCNRCGYNTCREALDFHHLDERLKQFRIGQALATPKVWDVIVTEVKKCALLCANCHRELHAGIWQIKEISIPEFVSLKDPLKKDTITGSCKVCGTDVYYGRGCCSRACAAKLAMKVKWPTKKMLIKMKKTMSRCEIARSLGVSECAVRKREKKYGI